MYSCHDWRVIAAAKVVVMGLVYHHGDCDYLEEVTHICWYLWRAKILDISHLIQTTIAAAVASK